MKVIVGVGGWCIQRLPGQASFQLKLRSEMSWFLPYAPTTTTSHQKNFIEVNHDYFLSFCTVDMNTSLNL